MAGGTGRIAIPEHAGQVPEIRKHYPQEQRHNKLQHRKRIKIKNVDLKFNVPKLKQDMEKKTSSLMSKTFKK